ncbi:hypothetical protein [Rhodococcus sp. LB1]|uniref:hypothetical protein n=1 Tax=Rhodococcus sp. LB1 TaxID=1807499 RepID=UPI0018D4CC43|nr:hypothetical protein [Rhodococcus sp. LB1]
MTNANNSFDGRGERKPHNRLALRLRIVLACAEPGMTNKQVAADLGICQHGRQMARPGQCVQPRKTGQDRRVGMLLEDTPGFGREMVSRLAGRIELEDQTTCLLTECHFRIWQLA